MPEGIRDMCYTRIASEMLKNRHKEELDNALKKAKDIADNAYITEGKPPKDFLAQVG